MPSIVKPLSVEASVTAANTVSNSTLVRIYAANTAVVTVADDGGAKGGFTIPAGKVEYIEKLSTDTVAADVAVLCTSVAFKA